MRTELETDVSSFRYRIAEVLSLISDREKQLEYQRAAPVNVAGELFNQWEDWYHPDDPAFRKEFSPRELAALAKFGGVLDRLAVETAQELPALETFMATAAWVQLRDAAAQTLRDLENQGSIPGVHLMHCCAWLKNVLSNMNGKGMSVVPRERYGRSFFAFRCRSVDQALWSKIALQSAIDVAHAQAAEVAINHCPGCGTPLEQLIDANPEEFAQLCRQVED